MNVHHKISTLLLVFCALVMSSALAQQKTYYLITSSLNTSAAADDAAAKLKSEGYNAQVIPNGSSSYRISIYSAPSRDEVEAFATSQKQRSKPTGWILEANAPSTMAARGPQATPHDPSIGTGTLYHLVSASLATYNDAEKLLTTLEAKGYEPYIIFPKGGTKSYRVGVFYSHDRKEVEAYNSMVKKREGKGGWILEEEDVHKESLGVDESNLPTDMQGRGLRETDQAAASSGTIYHLITGSFDKFEEAKRTAESLKLNGHNPVIIFPDPDESDKFRISIYRSTSRDEVVAYKEVLDSQGKSSGWIYIER